jgi:hypothetical protein
MQNLSLRGASFTRHCEERSDVATSCQVRVDCFASLAITKWDGDVLMYVCQRLFVQRYGGMVADF